MNAYSPDNEHETPETNDPGLPALATVVDILDTLETLVVENGMAYYLDLSNHVLPDGRRLLVCDVWAQQSDKNTHLAPGSDDWTDDLLQPIVSSVNRTVDGVAVKSHGWVVYDDNSQDDLHRLLRVLLALRLPSLEPITF